MLLSTVVTCSILSCLLATALASQLYKVSCLQCFRPVPAGKRDLLKFHSSDYLSFLQNVSIDNQVRIVALNLTAHSKVHPQPESLKHVSWLPLVITPRTRSMLPALFGLECE